MSRIRRRLGGFALLQFFGLLAPFLILPIVARIGGVEGWSSIVIGQSLGAFLSGVISYGWNLVGPAKIASLTLLGRQETYAVSLSSRLIIAIAAIPAGGIVAGLLSSDSHMAIGSIAAIAGALGGLSVGWFAVGAGQPMLIFWYELVPRLIAVGSAAMLLLLGVDLVIYPLLLAGVSILGTSLVSRRILKGWRLDRQIFSKGIRELGAQRKAAFTTILAGAYGSMPTAIIGTFSTVTSAGLFAAGEKLYRASLFSVIAIGNSFQGWVAEPLEGSARWRRMLISLFLLTIVGLTGGASIAFLGPWVTGVFFGLDLAASFLLCVAFGLAFFAVSVSTVLGRHILVPFGRVRSVLLSTSMGALCGVPAIALLGLWYGAEGGAIGFALGETLVMVIQACCVGALYRSTSNEMNSKNEPTEQGVAHQ